MTRREDPTILVPPYHRFLDGALHLHPQIEDRTHDTAHFILARSCSPLLARPAIRHWGRNVAVFGLSQTIEPRKPGATITADVNESTYRVYTTTPDKPLFHAIKPTPYENYGAFSRTINDMLLVHLETGLAGEVMLLDAKAGTVGMYNQSHYASKAEPMRLFGKSPEIVCFPFLCSLSGIVGGVTTGGDVFIWREE